MTNRTAHYDDYRRQNQGRYLRCLATLEEHYHERTARQRPRDTEEERLLVHLDIARRDRLLTCGELERLGPRRWRWRL